MNTQEKEIDYISLLLKNHPTILLSGPPITSMVRTVESIISIHNIQETKDYCCSGSHPDILLYDGRTVTVQDARDLRSDATRYPALLDRKYIIIYYIERPNYVVAPVLLKLIEEPPSHFSIILATNNITNLVPTILSRSLRYGVDPSSQEEIEWWLNFKGVDIIPERVSFCGGDPDAAENMDLGIVKKWVKDWSGVLLGGSFSQSFVDYWGSALEEANECTQIVCWDMLSKLSAKNISMNILWREVSYHALIARNKCQEGRMNKILSTVVFFRCYAFVKTIQERGK